MTRLSKEEAEYAVAASKSIVMTMFVSLEPQQRIRMVWNSIAINLRKTDPAPPMSADIRRALLELDAAAVRWSNRPDRFVKRELRLIWIRFVGLIETSWDVVTGKHFRE